MSLLTRLHSYIDGEVIISSNHDDEFNQILVTLGAIITGVDPSRIIVSGFSDASDNAVLEIKSFTGGIPVIVETVAVKSFINTTGQLQINFIDSDLAEIRVLSNIKCNNLNADFLSGVDSTDLQTALYGFITFSVSYPDSTASINSDKPEYICTDNGGKVTKLKLKQDGVASANAVTTITFKKNGVSIGTATINGNSVAVVTNDIADSDLVENDILTTEVTTYSGDTKHTDITAIFHIKKKFKI